MCADRKALARNAKANVKYNNSDASDDEEEDPSQSLQTSMDSQEPLQKESNHQAEEAAQKQTSSKAKHVKPGNKGKRSKLLSRLPELPAAKPCKLKDPIPLNVDVPAVADEGDQPQASVTAGARTSPEHRDRSPGSLNQHLTSVPDTVVTVPAAKKPQAHLKAAPPAAKWKVCPSYRAVQPA
jgi:hypothetical protein